MAGSFISAITYIYNIHGGAVRELSDVCKTLNREWVKECKHSSWIRKYGLVESFLGDLHSSMNESLGGLVLRIGTVALCCTQKNLPTSISCISHTLIVNRTALHGALRACCRGSRPPCKPQGVCFQQYGQKHMLLLGSWPAAPNIPAHSSCDPHVSRWRRGQTFLCPEASLCHFGAAGHPSACKRTNAKLNGEWDTLISCQTL